MFKILRKRPKHSTCGCCWPSVRLYLRRSHGYWFSPCRWLAAKFCQGP